MNPHTELKKAGFKKTSFFSNKYTLLTTFGLVEITILRGWVAIYSEFKQMYEGYIDLQQTNIQYIANYFKIIAK